MPVRSSVSGSARLLAIRNLPVLLDTNILIQGSGGKTAKQRKAIKDFCRQNSVCICDTVYYEYLRNCSYEHFKERRVEVEDWPCASGRMTILREENALRMFEQLWILYLHQMRRDPRRFVHQNIRDLMIASAAVQNHVDAILTTDHSGDFPGELFEDQAFDLAEEGSTLVLHLKTFRRPYARECWMECLRSKMMSVNFQPFAKV